MLKLQFKDQRSDPIWVVDKSFALGSADDNQLVIDDSSVSLQHARISCNDSRYTLRDLGSSEGVYVNNQRINKKPISNGDTIRIGRVELLVVDPFIGGNQKAWSLIACSSWLSGQEFVVPTKASETGVKVGRSSHCDIIFPGTHLSREHVELRINGDHLLVKDLASANGTFINDVRVSEGVLYPGDKLRLDVYNFKVFGPGVQPTVNNEHKTVRAASLVPEQGSINLASASAGSKHWKTRPTSPGNRTDASNIQRKNTALIAVACVLCAAVVALGLYLFLG